MQALGEQTDLTWWGIGYEGYAPDETVFINLGGKKFDFIFTYKPLQFKGLEKLNTPLVIEYNEMIDRPNREEIATRELSIAKPDIVIGRLKNEMQPFVPLFPNIHWLHIPHAANKNIFHDYELKTKYDVTLIGNLNEQYYPFRQRLYRLLPKFANKGFRVKYKFFPRSADNDLDKHLVSLAQFINSSKICITCSSFMKERIAKLVEIPMSGSVLACDTPPGYEDTLCPARIKIEPWMTDSEIINTLVSHLENSKKLEKMKEQSLEWAQKYTMEKYATKVTQHLEDYKVNREIGQ